MAIIRPVNLQKPFADAGARRDIPVDSQIGIDNGAASFTDGFPPLTRTPIAAGGIPPKGVDMNGILFALSQHTVFQNSGGQYRFDAVLAAEVGGYSAGMILQSNDGLISYVSIVDGNTDDFNTNPVSIGVSWIPVGMPRATTSQAQALANDSVALTPKGLADVLGGGSLSSAGYAEIPLVIGGAPRKLVIQWGTPAVGAAGAKVIFPVAFPTALGRVVCNSNGTASSGAALYIQDSSFDRFGFIPRIVGSPTSVIGGGFYIAIGW